MATRIIDENEWHAYFTNLSKTLEGRHVRIEIVGATLGDQVLAASSQLLGITYEPKKNTIEVFLPGLDHVIDHPKSISVEEDNGALVAMDIVDRSDQHQIVTLLPLEKP
ncbi:DUF5335 family protein (plasmid) [Rhizobium ruizarguesonis]|nr:DUF5335 family protein [Rhizobium ruizarguesonis]